jgi:hypothetical protein
VIRFVTLGTRKFGCLELLSDTNFAICDSLFRCLAYEKYIIMDGLLPGTPVVVADDAQSDDAQAPITPSLPPGMPQIEQDVITNRIKRAMLMSVLPVPSTPPPLDHPYGRPISAQAKMLVSVLMTNNRFGPPLTSAHTDILRLRWAIYGLRQASRAWNERLEGELAKRGFVQSDADPSLWTFYGKGGVVLSLFYVDDGLVAARTSKEPDALVDLVESMFEIRRLGKPVDFLGIEIQRNNRAGTITQMEKAEALAAVHGVQEGSQGKAQSPNVSRVFLLDCGQHNPGSQ